LSPLDRLKRLFDRKSFALSDSDFPLSIFGLTQSVSGIAVSAATAMRVPAVAAAVELIATAIGTLPVKVYAREKGGKVASPTHAAYRLVHDEANPWTSAADLRTQVTTDALLNDKGGFAAVVRIEGKPVELHRLDPSAVTVKTDEITGEPFYLVGQGTDQVRYAFTDIIHLRPFAGQSPISRAREAIGLALLLEEHAAGIFAKGAKPSGILSFAEKVGDERIAKVRKAFQADGRGGLAILDQDAKYQPFTLSSVDNQFADMRHFQIEEISRAFRVSPVFLSELGRATWSNAEQMGKQFLTYTLRPWLAQWETQYRRTLLSEAERESMVIEFLTDDLLTVDHAARATAYGQYRSMGVMTANEVRAGLNLPEHANGNELANPYTTSGKGEAA
jgi:HK97 family phage portal protein